MKYDAAGNLDLLLAGEARLLVPDATELVPRPVSVLLAEVVPSQPHQVLVDRGDVVWSLNTAVESVAYVSVLCFFYVLCSKPLKTEKLQYPI
ncbi:hypothetical protein RHSIM_Rhsim04G0114300 [Rhododendron simsii]|uniref:Uncharacterized protein n=1 Tax=Rhododendron simsii TaxID=118357 RepID=A0A834H0Z5_RHOSS|nr:hypothetical protein RHSIM_Rhsim04G0114300 [Rhododendron simsii]